MARPYDSNFPVNGLRIDWDESNSEFDFKVEETAAISLGTATSTVRNALACDSTLAVTGSTTFTGDVNGMPVAELTSSDPSQKVTYMNDFLGDLLTDEIAVTAGSGTGNAVAISAGQGGRLSITTASDDGAITANASAVACPAALDWRADSGGLVMEARLQLDAITDVALFCGFTDVLPGTTLEMPIFLVAGDIDSDASNACGVGFDTDGTTDQWFHGGVAADTDTVPAYSGGAPSAATYYTIRVEVSAAGAVTGYIDGTAIGTAVASAVTATTALAPVIVVANRGAAARVCLVDYVWVQADR